MVVRGHPGRGFISSKALLLLWFPLLWPGTAKAAPPNVAADGGSNALQIDLPERVLEDHTEPHFAPNRSGIVQLFEWKFADIAAECEQFLSPMGFAGVQVSPVMEHVVVPQRPWRERYQPISYHIATRSGDEADFLDMSRRCNAVGIRIYVDVVLNHMAGPYDEQTAKGETLLTGTAGSTANASSYDFPSVPYSREHFHKKCALKDYMDAHEVRNCELENWPDLDHYRLHVRGLLVEMLNRLVELGAAGFRVDSAKYIWPIDVKLIFKDVKDLNSSEFDLPENARPFVYQSVVDMGVDGVSKTEYSSYGCVSEYLYAAELSIIVSGKAPLSSLINWGPAMGFLPHQQALVFVDSHDGQRVPGLLGRNRLLSYKQPRQFIMATVFMLVHPYGRVKRLMSSYYFAAAQPDQGPPMEADSDEELIRSPEFDESSGLCTHASGWVCEHRWPPIARMLKLVNALDELHDGVINFQTDGPHHIAFCRGHKAFVALNSDLELTYTGKVQTCLPAGTYCDVISGGIGEDGSDCVGKRVVIDEEGYAELQLPAVLYTEIDTTNEYGNGEDAADDKPDDEDSVVDSIDWNGEFGVLAIYEEMRLRADGEMLAAKNKNLAAPADATENESQGKEIDASENEANQNQINKNGGDASEFEVSEDEVKDSEINPSEGSEDQANENEANENEITENEQEAVTKDVSPEAISRESLETEKNAKMEDGATDASVEAEKTHEVGTPTMDTFGPHLLIAPKPSKEEEDGENNNGETQPEADEGDSPDENNPDADAEDVVGESAEKTEGTEEAKEEEVENAENSEVDAGIDATETKEQNDEAAEEEESENADTAEESPDESADAENIATTAAPAKSAEMGDETATEKFKTAYGRNVANRSAPSLQVGSVAIAHITILFNYLASSATYIRQN